MFSSYPLECVGYKRRRRNCEVMLNCCNQKGECSKLYFSILVYSINSFTLVYNGFDLLNHISSKQASNGFDLLNNISSKKASKQKLYFINKA